MQSSTERDQSGNSRLVMTSQEFARINTLRSQHMMNFCAQFFLKTLLCKSDYQCVDESRLQDYREQSNKKLSGSVSVTLCYVPLNDRTPLARLCRVRLDFDTTREREDVKLNNTETFLC